MRAGLDSADLLDRPPRSRVVHSENEILGNFILGKRIQGEWVNRGKRYFGTEPAWAKASERSA